MNKKIALTMILVSIFVMLMGAHVYAQDNIRIQVNGEEIIFEGQQPIIQEGRTLVPARGVFESLGYEVIWDSNTQAVIIRNSQTTVIIGIGEQELSINYARPIPMDVPAQIINGSTMIPLRAVAQAIGAEVYWDGAHRLATIICNGTVILEQTQTQPEQQAEQTLTDYANATFQNLLDAGYSFEQALDIFEEQIFIITNQERVNHGVQPLVWDAALARAARLHSQDMAVNNFFNHVGSDGSRSHERASRAGYPSHAAENIGASGYGTTPIAHVRRWMNSPGHRAQMLQLWVHFGAGTWFIVEDGYVIRGSAVQMFGQGNRH